MHTALTRLFDLRYPLISAPMTPQAGGALARAVTRSGALGMLGLDEDEPLESIRAQLALLGDTKPFGLGLVRWVVDRRPELVDIVLEARPALVALSFGDPAPYVERFRAAGIRIASQVQSRDHARTALDAGVDLLVAQGTEAGGHTGSVGTLPLLQIVLDVAGNVPVVAAGGIATGAGLAAVLAAGACGAWIGTPFLGAAEARSNDVARAQLIAARETDTVLTSAFDRVQHKGWPGEFRGRALANAFTQRWHEREDALTPQAESEFRAARERKDYTVANLYAGQTVALIRDIEPAAAIVERIAADARERLARVATLL